MQQCRCTAAVLISAWNLAASLPAIAGLTPIHHSDSRPGNQLSGLLVQPICLLHLHQAPWDEKPYAAHISGSRRIDDASHSTSLAFRTSLRNIGFAAMVRFI
jgi:hypothetical protein